MGAEVIRLFQSFRLLVVTLQKFQKWAKHKLLKILKTQKRRLSFLFKVEKFPFIQKQSVTSKL